MGGSEGFKEGNDREIVELCLHLNDFPAREKGFTTSFD